MQAMITIIQAVPAILAARAIIAMLAITIAMVAMIAILLALPAMTAVLLVASNECQCYQLSAVCATTPTNCPGGQLVFCFSCPLIWHCCCSCYELPSPPFLPADSKTANQQHRKAEQPKASTDLHWKLSSNKCQSLYFRLKLGSLRNCHHSGL